MKIIKASKRKIVLLLIGCLIICSTPVRTLATTIPYDSYNYGYRSNVTFTPAPYVPKRAISGSDLQYNGESIGVFSTPQDICKSNDGRIYLADTGNNRIIVLNTKMDTVLKIISSFSNNGSEDGFASPTGVAVNADNDIYIADSMNGRIVILDDDNNLKMIIENPTGEVLEEGYIFTPLKVTVDYANRVYCIAQNMFEGIMVFDADGQFTSFYGTIKVSLSLWEKFWRKVATKEERSRQELFIPTEFTGVDVDDEGFVYASYTDEEGKQAVMRLNPKGQDVIKKGENENIGGDLWTAGGSIYSGVSRFIDVVYRGNGIYSAVDSKRGRVFTYDREGNLLYIFGGLGSQEGTFVTPVAIEAIDDIVITLDSYRSEILVFNETEYGNLINHAVALRFDGDETQAIAMWEKVLKLDENNELANTGIGKAYLTAGDYEKAMYYLKIGMSREYYSIAYKRYRNEMLKENIDLILTGGIILVIALVVTSKLIKKKKGKLAEGGLLDG